jgi:hypothetical protein
MPILHATDLMQQFHTCYIDGILWIHPWYVDQMAIVWPSRGTGTKPPQIEGIIHDG